MLARSALVLVGLTACASQEIRPFTGPAPHSILIGPVITGPEAMDLQPAQAAQLALLAEAPLRARGYRVPSSADMLAKLNAMGWGAALIDGRGPSPDVLQDIGRSLHVDAVLSLTVRRWDVSWGVELEGVSHDFDYVLRSTATGQVLWRQQSAGEYRRAQALDWGSTLAEDGPALTPVRGMGAPQFADPAEAARAVHRWALARLPLER